jgi:pyrroline-5-carboxylate reductase
MASAIIRGLLENQHYRPDEIACTCGDDPSGPDLAKAIGIQYRADLTPAVASADAVVVACKPQQFQALDAALAQAASGTLVLSILAGTPLERLRQTFSNAGNIVRTMPNTPGQIGAGVTAYAPLTDLNGGDLDLVEKILSSLGNFHQVEEADLDAVTALSGSGPAYVFEFAAALREAGTQAGLPKELAASLTTDTLLGAAMLLAQSEATPEELRQAVTSPGGTTAAALEVLEKAGFRALIEETVAAAKARSIELAGA